MPSRMPATAAARSATVLSIAGLPRAAAARPSGTGIGRSRLFRPADLCDMRYLFDISHKRRGSHGRHRTRHDGRPCQGPAVIETFAPDRPRQSIADVAAASGLDRATARRCLLTLGTLGYADYDGKFFTLTPRVLRLGTACLAHDAAAAARAAASRPSVRGDRARARRSRSSTARRSSMSPARRSGRSCRSP